MKKRISLLACLVFVTAHGPARLEPQHGAGAGSTPRYELEIKLDPDRHSLEGRGDLWIPASNEPRDFIRLGLGKNMRDLVVEVVEPEECAGAVALEQGFPLGGNNGWVVRPAKPFPAGRQARLRFAWRGGEKSSFVFYLGPEGSFASGINTAWYPTLNDGLAVGALRITVPSGLTVHANGLRRGTPEEGARGLFRYESVSPSFFAFVAGKYIVVRREGAIPISVYSLKPREGLDEYVEGCRKSIEVLSDEFGPYPSGEFAIVETPAAQSQAAGFAGASVTSFIMVTGEFLEKRFNLAYYGHEIAHQWWGNLIRRAGERGNWMLSEAMAQYGSLRAVETLEGAAAAERYRRTGYPGYIDNQSGLGYLKVLAAGRDFPLSNIPDNADRAIPDGKGFQVLDLLSRTVGRDNFRGALRDFTKKHAFQRVTWDEFLQAVERGAGRNLQWFYDQWFERTGVPEWQLSWRQEGETVRGEITQSQPYYRATLEVRAESSEGREQSLTVEVDGAKTEFTLPVKFVAQTVALDPHFQVLRWTPEYRAAVSERKRSNDK
jgi:Peptidase family M1 domain